MAVASANVAVEICDDIVQIYYFALSAPMNVL
jgi:hypothetical protein